MALSAQAQERLQVLHATASVWAPHALHPDLMLARELVDEVRAQRDEPVSLGQLNELALDVPDVPASELRVERRQRPDPAGEGSLGYYVLLQSRPMTDSEYEAKVNRLWARLERARAAAKGNAEEFALYQQLHAKYGQAS